ncbi:MAG: arginine--tRNA ligase [Planctomycetota bacterium]|jgi:arginyl-tRNA synthetase
MSTTRPAPAETADPIARLDAALRKAMVDVVGAAGGDTDPLLRPSQRPELGDFQANAAMGLAKQVGAKPRELAERIVAVLDLGELAEPPEVAGPGFINIRLRPAALAAMLDAMDDAALGVRPDPDRHPVVIDLCGVNVAKQMHVGHLRSSIIGDTLARALERLGRTVLRENHLGDWGLPIAMVLDQLRRAGTDLDTLTLTDLDRAYRDAQLAARGDEPGLAAVARTGAGPHRLAELEAQNAGAAEALAGARDTLVRLQRNEPDLVADWRKLIDCTLRALYESLDVLGVAITEEHNRGESSYRGLLPQVVDAFVEAGRASEDDGAIVVRFADRERPLLIRKSDGGFLYATTDLAGVRTRVTETGADLVIYVVDARQRDHFRDVFDAARLMGWDRTPDGATADLRHVPFGSVLGPDRRPLKTRSGENVTLRSLLQEAVDRGTEEVRRRAADPAAPTHGLPDDAIAAIGRAVGIGAIKYADLGNDLVRDYIFDFDRMIAFEGHTGPYLQYAHARICSLFARAERDAADLADTPFDPAEPAERRLALALLRYGSVVADTGRTLEPHRLCTYLYDLAEAYSGFYQECPVLRADPARRDARLRLSDLVRRVLADGLDLLGIEAPARM